MGCHFLLQGIFPDQGSSLRLLLGRWILYHCPTREARIPLLMIINLLIHFKHLYIKIMTLWTSLVAQTVKRLSTMRETWVQSLGREDLLEKEMAIHSSAIAWKIPWTEEPDRSQSMGSHEIEIPFV